MSKKEKLLQIMRENGINELRYTKEFDLEADRPNGEVLLIGKEDPHVVYSVYRIYTDDGDPEEDQIILVDMMQPGDKFFDYYYNKCTEVLYASL